jgi:hypothetical protein
MTWKVRHRVLENQRDESNLTGLLIIKIIIANET